MNNDDYRQRGHNKATVKADCNDAENDNMIEMDEKVMELMEQQGMGQRSLSGRRLSDKIYQRPADILPSIGHWNMPRYLCCLCTRTNHLKRTAQRRDEDGENQEDLQCWLCSRATLCTVTTVYHHVYADGYFQMHGKTYRRTKL